MLLGDNNLGLSHVLNCKERGSVKVNWWRSGRIDRVKKAIQVSEKQHAFKNVYE